jgi:hypothetical protein
VREVEEGKKGIHTRELGCKVARKVFGSSLAASEPSASDCTPATGGLGL